MPLRVVIAEDEAIIRMDLRETLEEARKNERVTSTHQFEQLNLW